MAIGFEVDARDLENYATALLRAPDVLKQEMITAATRIGIAGEAKAKQYVPKRTRYLMRSITHLPGRWYGGGAEAIFGTATTYARYVEYGTMYMDERPYMTPAANAIAGDAANEWGNAIAKAMGAI